MRILMTGVLVFTFWAAGSAYWYVCKIKNHCLEEKTDIPAEISLPEVNSLSGTTLRPLALFSEGKPVLVASQNFQIKEASDSLGFSPEVLTFLDQAAEKIRESGKKLEIQSFFSEKEEKNQPQVGLQRGNRLQEMLVERGVAPEAISISTAEKTALFSQQDNPFFQLVLVSSQATDLQAGEKLSEPSNAAMDTSNTLKEVTKEILPPAPTQPIQFALNSAAFAPSANQQRYLQAVVSFLLEHQEKNMEIIGHSCDLGPMEINLELSRKRAEAIKKLFVSNQIPPERIKTTPMGNKAPLVPNTDEQARRKNRRVEIEIH